MTEEFFARVLVTLADCGVKSLIILGGAWLVARLLRRSAAVRHLVWQVAFVILLLLPPLSCLVPAFGVLHVVMGAPVLGEASARPDETESVLMKARPSEEPTGTSRVARGFLAYRTGGAVVLWLSGASLVVLRWVLAFLALINLRRRSLSGTRQRVDVALLSRRAGLKSRWELRTSEREWPSSAMTWGLFRPTVLLPRSSFHWSKQWLEAVLLHELAHVRRRDSVSQLLIEAVCALYWFNPLVWVCARAMRVEAERAADDLVLYCGVSPSAYAAELLRLAAAQARHQSTLAGYGLSVMNGSPIEVRIRSIVAPHHRRDRANLMEGMAAVAAVLLTLFLFLSYRSIGLASGVSGPKFSISRATMREEAFAEKPETQKHNIKPGPARPSVAADERRTEGGQSKGKIRDPSEVEDQIDLRQTSELPVPTPLTPPADLATNESWQLPAGRDVAPGRDAGRPGQTASQTQGAWVAGSDTVAGQYQADGAAAPIMRSADAVTGQRSSYERGGADILLPGAASPAEEGQHLQQRRAGGSADMLRARSRSPAAEKGWTDTRPRAPDIRSPSP